jgi:hypothetical protein
MVDIQLSICISHGYLDMCSFEKSPRHDTYMQRFEAELAQQCEKLVSQHLLFQKILSSTITSVYSVAGNGFG